MEFSTLLILLAVFFVFRLIQNQGAAATPLEPHGRVTNVDSEAHFKTLTSSGPVVIDFYATWCGPCRAVSPKVGELSEKYQNVRFIQVDVDKLSQVARQLTVTAMPTFVFFKDGKEFGQRVRGADLRSLENGIQALTA
ncbi:Thioredoxin [Penicillium hispanicum]|uniref:Thioredoxin n=1 Tax=Penicillium hispanicum TaxID=1080232 RepID=UPI0025422095|nr:Thioredoxin [Penicillium hispanicum]KAJ5573592.1 Thioredoxin [Penicillium hispanicum]